MDKTKIAIVDDLQSDRHELALHISRYMNEYDLEYTLNEYDSAEAFLAEYRRMDFDVVFMDIYMGDTNGVDAARQLRTYDRDCRIVFRTSSTDHVQQVVSLGVSHYLNKPTTEKLFDEAMENCCVRPKHDVPILEVQSGGIRLSLNTSRILYVDMQDRSVAVHMTQQTLAISDSFSSVTEPLLADRRFLLSVRGILVNMDHVDTIEEGSFRMKDGSLVPINIRNKKEIEQTYRGYLMKRMRGVR